MKTTLIVIGAIAAAFITSCNNQRVGMELERLPTLGDPIALEIEGRIVGESFYESFSLDIPSGSAVDLRWTIEGSVSSCSLKQGSSTKVSKAKTTRSYRTPSLSSDTTYTLICANGAKTVSENFTIQIEEDEIEDGDDEDEDEDSGDLSLIVVEGTSHLFPGVPTNTVGRKTLTLRNNGSRTIAAIGFSNLMTPFTLALGHTCIRSLAPNESCAMEVVFTPLVEGIAQGRLTVAYGGSPLHIDFGGIGLAPVDENSNSDVSIAEGQYISFPVVTLPNHSQKSITIRNNGNYAISNLAVRDVVAPFSLNSSNCPASLAPGGSCLVNFVYAPTAAGALEREVLLGWTRNGIPGTRSFRLAGSAQASSPVQLQRLNLYLSQFHTTQDFSFHPVSPGGTVVATVTLTNNTGSNRNNLSTNLISVPTFNSTGFYQCANLQNGHYCTFEIRFQPDVAGDHYILANFGGVSVRLHGPAR